LRERANGSGADGQAGRNVMAAARTAMERLRTALKEREALERGARQAQAGRMEALQKESARAEQERLRIAEENEAATRREAEAKARADQSPRLETAISRVVRAARAGDFDDRIATDFDENSLREVADGVNSLLQTVAGSLTEARETQRRLAQGDLTARMAGMSRGSSVSSAAQSRKVDRSPWGTVGLRLRGSRNLALPASTSSSCMRRITALRVMSDSGPPHAAAKT
jgi:hypothetical protein